MATITKPGKWYDDEEMAPLCRSVPEAFRQQMYEQALAAKTRPIPSNADMPYLPEGKHRPAPRELSAREERGTYKIVNGEAC